MTAERQVTTRPPVRRRRRPSARDWRVVVVFTALYVGACYLGRSTIVEGAEVSLVWPAAGVSVLWLVARARRPWPWLDLLALAGATWAVVASTGSTPASAAIGAGAAVAQALVCSSILAVGVPYVWAARGTRQLRRVPDLWWLLLAAGTSSVLSAPLVELAVVVGGAPWTWETALLWCARNTVSIIGISTLGWTFGTWLHERKSRRGVLARIEWWTDGSAGDYVAALLLAPVLYVVWFLELSDLAVIFPLIALTVWAGSRLPTRSVVLHTMICGVVTIQFTLQGMGPFAGLPDATTQVAVAQLYVGLVSVIGLALAIARDERRRLLRDLGSARDRAEEQAALLSTVVDTMSEGVRVVDAAGRVVVRNPIATLLLAGHTRLDAADSTSDLAGLSRLDGTVLPEHELPFRRALAGELVRDQDLLVRLPGTPEPRIVTFSSTPIPESSGGGVVTVLRDVTAERTELRRAAQVQASLLPSRGLEVPGFGLAARFVPAGSVGGDFYDWQRLPDGLVLTLADVMGKGPAAAILAATTRSVLHAQGSLHDVAGTLSATERAMDADLVNAGAFVTMFRAYVDATDGRVSYTDAGHGLSMIIGEDGSSRRLSATGLPLGIAPGPARTSVQTRMRPGDLLVTFSDGVLDAIGGSMGDLDQVRDVVRGTDTAEAAADAVLSLVEDTRHADDDLTVVTLKRAA
ncbi:SpoIIE family protein phosphatase [Cellulomonas endometrii]|uniref:SpoIIE family protein phosphatase n=1 Tax=Cellulomonas endometrii TaxID=3036301 RepID=UPI0024AE27A5|nr:SpoIIE family protein phosphatase [Cellulomonas endometrii]